jgi:hypothetical protein
MCAARCHKTVFHDVPIQGNRRRALRKALQPMMRMTVIPKEDLRLVWLHGAGLPRLRVTHSGLIESSSSQHSRSAAWGHALYDDADYDGWSGGHVSSMTATR